MSAPMVEMSVEDSFDERIARLASFRTIHAIAAGSIHRDAILQWMDEIAQEMVVIIWERARRGRFSSRKSYALAFLRASTRVFGTTRTPNGRAIKWEGALDAEGDTVRVAGSVNELRALAAWRIHKIWGDLTELQRAALTSMLDGESVDSVAARTGAHVDSVTVARRSAVQRINGLK